MILLYYQIKWSGKCMMHELRATIPRTKTKTLPLRKLESAISFMQCIIAKTYDSPSCYCCHLERHLKYYTLLKNNNNMPVKFFKYNQKLSDIVTNCEFDLRLNFALNGGHLGHHLN